VVRQRPRIGPDPEAPAEVSEEQSSIHQQDIYHEDGINTMEENDEIASREAAFMRGFLTA
ncbi:MAG: hypothetical protein ACOCWQ_00485, partial [Nanoarchaeota archaeon]